MVNSILKLDIIEFLKSPNIEEADLIVADPPYNMNVDKWDEFESQEKYFEFMESWLKLAYKKLSKSGTMYLFNNAFNNAILLPKLLDIGFIYKGWITWYKKDGFSGGKRRYVNNQETILMLTKSKDKYTFNADDIRVPYKSTDRMKHAQKKGILKNGKRWFPNPNGALCSDVWEITSERHKNKVDGKTQKMNHATPKPMEMIDRIIKASSNPGDLVYDLFSGTGTTSISAKKLSRNSIGCEIDENYFEKIKEKLDGI